MTLLLVLILCHSVFGAPYVAFKKTPADGNFVKCGQYIFYGFFEGTPVLQIIREAYASNLLDALNADQLDDVSSVTGAGVTHMGQGRVGLSCTNIDGRILAAGFVDVNSPTGSNFEYPIYMGFNFGQVPLDSLQLELRRKCATMMHARGVFANGIREFHSLYDEKGDFVV